MTTRTHVAESVLQGHPDRLADGVAEGLVDAAIELDPDTLVGVEVALHRRVVYVTGRIAAGDEEERGRLRPDAVDALVRRVYADAGYEGRWSLEPRVVTDLDLGTLPPDERTIRPVSDDQNVVVGHAAGREATGWLPPAPFAARHMRDALAAMRRADADRLGPDGKVLVRIEQDGGRFAWRRCNVAVQHVAGLGFEEQFGLVLPALGRAAEALDAALPGLAASWRPEVVHLNGAGEFSCGGPHGDNGLSGKKLVVDHYGPGVPIGGGALCGKDPHKVDRVGALRARQLAVRLARASGARAVTTWLGYLPGQAEPDHLDAEVDGDAWSEARIRAAVPVPDLSIEGTYRGLELGGVRWREVAARGYFGGEEAWER